MFKSKLLKTFDVETLHERILDVFTDGIYVTNSEGKTLAVNRMYEKITGLQKEELIGKTVHELINKGVFDIALNPEIVKTGKEKTSVQVTKTGRRVLLNGYPIIDESGNVVLVITFVRDITLLSQLQDQLKEQQEVIDKYREVQIRNENSDVYVFESPEMSKLINLLENVAKTDATVLLLGETGVGKGVLAQFIHRRSLRYNEPFFKVDCSTIPENLIESELFGYEAGAFSGAGKKGKPGLFEMADKGTLFLDEIGELPLHLQAKLLRAIQDQELIRVGSTQVRKIDVRFIAATNRDLREEVEKGNFRSDLYYRLRVACFKIPPLRERRKDILPLVRTFTKKYNNKYRKNIAFTKEVEKVFENYKWPGNVRELDNFIQSLIVTQDKEVLEVSDLPHYVIYDRIDLEQSGSEKNQSLNDLVANFEKKIIKDALEVHGSIAKAAKLLKVDRSTVYRKAKKYSLIE